MKRITAIAMGLTLAGCASEPGRAGEDFVYEPISNEVSLSVKASSASTGKEFEIRGICEAGAPLYTISQASTELYGSDTSGWTTYLGGQKMLANLVSYEDADTFKAALSSLELVKPGSLFSAEQRVKVASSQVLQMPNTCEEMRRNQAAEIRKIEAKQQAEDEHANARVAEQTGVIPMFSGSNRMPLNGLASMSLRGDISRYKGKFFWAEAGDYQVVQVMDGMILMVSRLSPQNPAVLIMMNTTPQPGESSFLILKKPLMLLGISPYETVLGLRKPALILKEI